MSLASGTDRKVAFLGLGKMGAPIAHNFLKAGIDLTVYNRTAAKMAPLVENGARGMPTPSQAAAGADVVFTCLMDDQSMMDVAKGADGLLAGLSPGGIHIGMATISPGCAATLAGLHREHGSVYVAGPIFGRPNAAKAGTLLTYTAGDAGIVEGCAGLFQLYSRSHVYVGEDHRVANSIKLAFNFMLISLVELFSEVFILAEKSNIDLELMDNLVMAVLAHPAMKEYTARIRGRNFEPAFDLSAGFKDVQLMLQASSEVQAPLAIAGIVREKFLSALAYGMAEKDWSAIYEVTRMNAGLA